MDISEEDTINSTVIESDIACAIKNGGNKIVATQRSDKYKTWQIMVLDDLNRMFYSYSLGFFPV